MAGQASLAKSNFVGYPGLTYLRIARAFLNWPLTLRKWYVAISEITNHHVHVHLMVALHARYTFWANCMRCGLLERNGAYYPTWLNKNEWSHILLRIAQKNGMCNFQAKHHRHGDDLWPLQSISPQNVLTTKKIFPLKISANNFVGYTTSTLTSINKQTWSRNKENEKQLTFNIIEHYRVIPCVKCRVVGWVENISLVPRPSPFLTLLESRIKG